MLDNALKNEHKLDKFCEIYNKIKKENSKYLSNIYIDFNKIKNYFHTRECFIYNYENCIFILIPMHNTYYDLFYICNTPEMLSYNLSLLQKNNITMPIRATIVGRNEELNTKLVKCFNDNLFYLAKKMIRTLAKKADKSIIDAMRILASDVYHKVSFALEADANEIFEILNDNFDLISDNIPELEDIIENIRKNQVTILRQDGKIASLHYFNLHNGILYGYFDVTRMEYRGGKSYFIAISLFEHDYFKSTDIKVTRSIGWRDVTKARLIRHASQTNQNADGVYIYNMVWEPARTAMVEKAK